MMIFHYWNSGNTKNVREEDRGLRFVGVPKSALKIRILAVMLVVVLVLATYEGGHFYLGSCQGYGGAQAFNRSIAGRVLGLWSIDPMTCP